MEGFMLKKRISAFAFLTLSTIFYSFHAGLGMHGSRASAESLAGTAAIGIARTISVYDELIRSVGEELSLIHI